MGMRKWGVVSSFLGICNSYRYTTAMWVRSIHTFKKHTIFMNEYGYTYFFSDISYYSSGISSGKKHYRYIYFTFLKIVSIKYGLTEPIFRIF